MKKREDEKRAREEAEEQKMLEQVREREREEARARNGGVLPYEMMNEQEKANYDFEQEKETKRLQKEAEKKKREDVKVCHPPGPLWSQCTHVLIGLYRLDRSDNAPRNVELNSKPKRRPPKPNLPNSRPRSTLPNLPTPLPCSNTTSKLLRLPLPSTRNLPGTRIAKCAVDRVGTS